jgi:hypothetical protein
MKKILTTLLLLIVYCNNSFAGFVHPMEYKPEQEKEVIDYIKTKYNNIYCNEANSTFCSLGVLTMSIQGDITAFKKLMQVNKKDKKILDQAIKTYCQDSYNTSCTYAMISMTYDGAKEPLRIN